MADFNNRWIEIFKVGDYGDKGKYSTAELDEIVSNFNPATWKPVLTPPTAQVGHADTAPALGMVGALKREGERLLAQFEKVHPKLQEAVSDGRFPNRSVGLYRNPQGHGLTLRHVAFLGAVPPEVKGLAPVQFSDGEFIAIDFTESPAGEEREEPLDLKEVSKTVDERIRAFFSDLFGSKKAGASFSEEELNQKLAAMRQEMEGQMAERFGKLEKENQELRKESAASQTSATLARFDERVAAQQKAGRIVPAMSGTIALMRERVAQGGVVKFTEGEGEKAKTVEKPVLEFALGELDRLPQIVPLGELARGGPVSSKVVMFTEPRNGEGVTDPHSVQVAEMAEQLAGEVRKEFPNFSEFQVAREAYRRAIAKAGAPGPAQPGGIAAGQV